MAAPSLAGAALDRAQAYLLDRQSPEGGFCFYRGYYLEEPNLSDTWHAIAALELLGADLPDRGRHARFVIGQRVDQQPGGLYCRVRSLLALGVEDPAADAVCSAVAGLQVTLPAGLADAPSAGPLQRLRTILWLKRHFGLPADTGDLALALSRAEHAGGGYGMPPNLTDTEAAIALLLCCSHEPAAHTGAFVQGLAVSRFGFRLTADSLSPNLETVCAGMLSCHRLGVPVPYADDAAAFVLSCQTGNGGFARASGALPDLALTHRALKALAAHAAPRSLRGWVAT